MGVRPHFVTPLPQGEASAPVTGKVLITELSGSESTAHFEIADRAWVSHSHGIHPFRVGEEHDFHIDTTGCIYFHADGRRVVA